MNYLFFYCGEIPGYVHKVVNTILSVDKESSIYFLSDKNIKDTLVVGYTKGVSADKVDDVRADGLAVVDKINAQFEKLFEKRMNEGSSFKFLDVDFFAPQKIDDETELIPSREN